MGRLLKHLITLSSLLVLFCLGLSASAIDCESSFKKLKGYQTWSMSEQNLILEAKDLFPADYLKKVLAERGPLVFEVLYYPGKGYLRIIGNVEEETYVRVALIQDPENPKSLIIDELNLQDPLRSDESSNLNLDQMGKGLPPQVFRYVKDHLFEVIKAGGFEQIKTHSQQHYTVLMLYRRFVGMEPLNEASRKKLEYLDSLYRFSRKELPEEYRPKDIEEFSRWLGSGGEDPSGITLKRAQLLKKYLETGKKHRSFTLLKDSQNRTLGALFKDKETADSNIVFFDKTDGKTHLLSWYGLAATHQIELVKTLP